MKMGRRCLAAFALATMVWPIVSKPPCAQQLHSSVFGSGGGASAVGSLQQVGTVGQILVGQSAGSATLSSGYWWAGGLTLLAVGPTIPPGSMSFSVDPVAPNPGRGEFSLRLSLPTPGRVELALFDASGRIAGRVGPLSMGAGVHSLPWTGVDVHGLPAPPGIYFARLLIDGRERARRRFVLLR
jgi:hypothetical protein